ncbi:hypothetical protein IC229_18495 [Spirosoma sp. BT702]|uniref:Uncharacterized protein n=1 Tax=Spirosoma profusum TaxID=2771354 RepID=A0A927ARP2_9BACT|nr:hypothetical protein [Spirosoma profusum]MBD2702643.1 hypothetical protein [Spirosoma profusum]
MATIIFQAEDIHYEENYYPLFIETYNPDRTNKEREAGWEFELDDSIVRQIVDLCQDYHTDRFMREAFCIVRHMQEDIAKNKIRISKSAWESGLGESINNLERWLESAQFEKIFSDSNLDYFKVKQKDSQVLIKYEGVLLDFIRQAVLEKAEREKEYLNKLRLDTHRVVWQAKDHLKPQETKRGEKHFAYYIAWFFRDQLDNQRLNKKYVNKERIDEFGAELMKIAGFEFICDTSDMSSVLHERKMTFRSWRTEYKKFLEKHNLIP